MYRTGRVTVLTKTTMQIRLDAQADCGSCANAPCGGLFSDWFNRSVAGWRQAQIEVPRLPGVTPGEPIRLELPPQLALQLAFIAYGLPVLAVLAGALLSRLLTVWWGDPAMDHWLAPILALAGFIGGLIAYKPLYAYLAGRSGTKSSPPINASRMIVSG